MTKLSALIEKRLKELEVMIDLLKQDSAAVKGSIRKLKRLNALLHEDCKRLKALEERNDKL